ncbi:MAG TPA: macrolide family glycosyltransferase [Chloroflexota bacterium]
MSTFVFVEMPAPGHVNPSLPIARELVRRGERVEYVTDAEFQSAVERTGATFHPHPTGVLTSRMIAEATQTGDLTRVPTVILRATESLLPHMLDELPKLQPAAVVLDSNAVWGHAAAKLLRLPRVSLMTTLILSSSAYTQLRPREWLHMLGPALPNIPHVLAARSRVLRRFGTSVFPRPAFPARGDLNIALLPRDFQPDLPAVDNTFRFVGPVIDPDTRSGKLAFEPSESEPVVYISLGTLHRGSVDFFQQCFTAFGAMPARFLLAVGAQTDVQALGPIPSNFVVRASVPQLEVLRHAAVFITHGGMNSALEGLWCGVPLIVIPQHLEQLAIGRHVASRGAAVVLRQHVAGERVTAIDLRNALAPMLSQPSYRAAAQTIQQSLRLCGGYRQAADEIQALVARSPVGTTVA